MGAAGVQLLLAATLWMMPCIECAATAATELLAVTGAEADVRMLTGAVSTPHSRRKRAVSPREINALLNYHNRVRSQVFPPAANMEYMVSKHRLF